MGLLALTNYDLYKELAKRGEGITGRFVSFLKRGVTDQGREWLQFKIAVKKYAETISDKCKYEYYIVKAWGADATQCEKLLQKGCTIKFAGEFMKGNIKTDEGIELGEIRLIQLLDVRYQENKKQEDKNDL